MLFSYKQKPIIGVKTMRTICDQMIDADYELAWWQYEQSLREEEERKAAKERRENAVPMYPFGSWDGFESSYDAALRKEREIYNS